MSYTALYRKYRSQTFDDLVGQEHIIRTLRQAVDQGKISHAYLFTGPRGTGKTSTARLLAKALNCTDGPMSNPPEDDPICIEIAQGSCMDVIELDAASESGVDNIRRAVVDASSYQPAYCRYKIFIIDEVHDLSASAFDALLKTIEEPPPHVVFILATTELQKVPPTIRSRCQRYEFHRGSLENLVGRLQFVAESEGMEIEPAALTALARMADGGYRDALTLLEQAILTAEGPITLNQVYEQLGLIAADEVDRLLEALMAKDIAEIHAKLDEVFRRGRDAEAIVESLTYRLADLTRTLFGVESKGGKDVTQEAAADAMARRLGMDRILFYRAAMAHFLATVGHVTLPRHWIESEMVRLAMSPVPSAATSRHPAEPEAEPRRERPAALRQESKPVRTVEPVVKEPEVKAAVVPPREAPAQATETKPLTSQTEVVLAPEAESEASSTATGRTLEQAQEIWRRVVAHWSERNEKARAWLAGTELVRINGNEWTVEFPLRITLQRFQEKPKAVAAVEETAREWAKSVIMFQYESRADGGPEADVAPIVPTRAVESVFEGDQLVEEIQREFGRSES
ncbi:MAG: DNA polymerase III subunit gamma/tau [Fimbriimonadaceae bacterium]